MSSLDRRLRFSLLALRVTVFLVMILWSVDKLLNPDHASSVFANFYFMEGVGPELLAALGIGQALIEIAFVAGLFRTFTYGFVLVTHALSTLASWPGYMEPFDNLLFFAAWPMLAGCLALFLLREHDTLWSLDARREGRSRAGSEASVGV